MNLFRYFTIILLLSIFTLNSHAIEFNKEKNIQGKLADKPLFRNPVFDGAADPAIIWNKNEKKWFMFYTNRRANAKNVNGVTGVHGTRIGIAESSDNGATWKYRVTANINYRQTSEYTHWVPEVIEHKGLYHMCLTYVPGIFTDWNHPREILHLTGTDLLNWTKQPERILEKSGTGPEDGTMGGHAQVVVNGDRDFVIYFLHPERTRSPQLILLIRAVA